MRRRVVGIGRITVPAIGIETNTIPLHIRSCTEAVSIRNGQHGGILSYALIETELIVLEVAHFVDRNVLCVDRKCVAGDGSISARDHSISGIARTPNIRLGKVRRIGAAV